MSTRRALVHAAAAGLLVSPLAGHAQPARKLHRIGVLGVSGNSATLAGPQPRGAAIAALLRGLRELGWVYGETFVTETRGGENRPERFAALAAELVRAQVEVIVGSGPTLGALRQATSTIPVVMAAAADPVGDGFVQSLAHPGGNFTGLSNQSVELTGKRLEMLKELVPRAGPVAVLWDRPSRPTLQATEAAARQRGWHLLSLEVRDPAEIEAVFKAATQARAVALFVFASGSLYGHARRIADLAALHRLPAMYSQKAYVEAGGLISYSADINDLWHRAASFVDKILKGARPADLAVEQPTKFELVINLKTAKALGLAVPQSLLLRADEVIE